MELNFYTKEVLIKKHITVTHDANTIFVLIFMMSLCQMLTTTY